MINLDYRDTWVAWVGDIRHGTLEPANPECDLVVTSSDPFIALRDLIDALEASDAPLIKEYFNA